MIEKYKSNIGNFYYKGWILAFIVSDGAEPVSLLYVVVEAW